MDSCHISWSFISFSSFKKIVKNFQTFFMDSSHISWLFSAHTTPNDFFLRDGLNKFTQDFDGTYPTSKLAPFTNLTHILKRLLLFWVRYFGFALPSAVRVFENDGTVNNIPVWHNFPVNVFDYMPLDS